MDPYRPINLGQATTDRLRWFEASQPNSPRGIPYGSLWIGKNNADQLVLFHGDQPLAAGLDDHCLREFIHGFVVGWGVGRLLGGLWDLTEFKTDDDDGRPTILGDVLRRPLSLSTQQHLTILSSVFGMNIEIDTTSVTIVCRGVWEIRIPCTVLQHREWLAGLTSSTVQLGYAHSGAAWGNRDQVGKYFLEL